MPAAPAPGKKNLQMHEREKSVRGVLCREKDLDHDPSARRSRASHEPCRWREKKKKKLMGGKERWEKKKGVATQPEKKTVLLFPF